MAVKNAAVLHHVILNRAAIRPSELREKLGLNPAYNLAGRFYELLKAGMVVKVVKKGHVGTGSFYRATPEGIKADKAETNIQSVEEMVKESYHSSSSRKASTAPHTPMNAKANSAVDSISQLLDDYNRSNQMLKQIHIEIGNYLRDNQLL